MVSKKPIVVLSSDSLVDGFEILKRDHSDLTPIGCDSYAALPAVLQESGAEVVYSVRFDGTPRYPRQALLECPTVKWISVGGSGTDHLRPWDPQRITITNAAGVASAMMSEYALGAMLSFSLGLRGFHRLQQERRWDAGARVEPIEGKTLLLVGLGKTAQAMAPRAKALGLKVLGVRANPRPMENVDEVHPPSALPHLWPRADFILCAVPLTEATRGLIDEKAFAAMKPSAVLIDVSRGRVVEEKALLAALEQKKIKGAALDVFATEPLPSDHPLWSFENVILTPHCSSVYDGWYRASIERFSANLTRYRQGLPLENVVDPTRGY